MNAVFSDKDCKLILGLRKEAESALAYNAYSHTIFWTDEYPIEFVKEQSNFLAYHALLHQRARLYFNQALGDNHLAENPEDAAVWEWAKENLAGWIGFSRTGLTAAQIEEVLRLMREQGSK
jgi:hypothetical protein